MDESAAAGGEPQIPGGGETPSPEEIVQVLQAMVQSGEIDEATAQQVLQILAEGGGEGAPEGSPEDQDPAGAEGAPAESEDEVPEEVKAASAILYGAR